MIPAARGSAANEAPGDPRGPRKGRPRAHSSFLILEHPTASKVATAVKGGRDSEILCVLYDDPHWRLSQILCAGWHSKKSMQ